MNRLHELETKFRNELKGFVDRVIITLNQERYFVKKLEEIKNSVLVFHDDRGIEKEVKDTISSLLVKEITEEASHIDHLDEFYNLQEKIVSEVNKTYEKLNREDNIESMDKIMKQFYKDLTDIWEEIYSISFYQNSEIKINKI